MFFILCVEFIHQAMKQYLATSLLLFSLGLAGQDLPFREIPPYPATYSAETVLMRAIQGLGFRYYWASEGLRDNDLVFKPSEDGRSTLETLQHIHSLTNTIYRSLNGEVINQPNTQETNLEKLRALTLDNLEKACMVLSSPNYSLQNQKISFPAKEGTNDSPIWHLINGPLEDAVWHVGQIITFRRSSGNPYNSKASLFTGKLKN